MFSGLARTLYAPKFSTSDHKRSSAIREVTTSNGGQRIRASRDRTSCQLPSGSSLSQIITGATFSRKKSNASLCVRVPCCCQFECFRMEIERFPLRAGAMLLPVRMFQDVAQMLMILVKRTNEQYFDGSLSNGLRVFAVHGLVSLA